MAPSEKLPSELVGEILCRLPTKPLARSRAVCKPWNDFWEDKSFLNNYLWKKVVPQFILRTNSQICSVDIINLDDNDPVIEFHDVNLDIPCTSLVHCDGFLLSCMRKKGFVVWNPWLRQKRLIENHRNFRFCRLGYDNTRPQTGYKIFGVDFCFDATGKLYPKVGIYECKSDAWKFINAPCKDWRLPQLDSMVSMAGNLYWIAYDSATREYFIRSFDFSKEIFKTFCLLPATNEEEGFGYTQVLAVFKGDRLSVLRQSYLTRKIEILVTTHGNGEGEAVVWIKFMTVSIPNFPRLQHKCLDSQPSYFIDDDKRLCVCACDETGHACIYIVKGDVFKKIPIDSIVDLWPSHLTYIPVPFVQREEQGSEKLPSELVGEILCRLPTKSLARSRAVCKPWYAFWEDKSFLNNYLARARPQFILRTNSQICSVDIINLDDDPMIEVHDVNVDIPCTSLVHCDGFLLSCMWKKGFAVWNPWLRQKRLIENHHGFRFCGVGYDNTRPQTGYKIFGVNFCFDDTRKLYPKVAIYECKSDAWKFIKAPCEDWRVPQLDSMVSMAGNLYWIAYDSATREYFIRSFDFSKEIFKTFCLVPATNEEEGFGYTQVLAVFKRDRLSVLKQSYMTRKIEIMVTTHGNGEGEAVVWINFMTVSIPDLPRLQHKCLGSQPSYFVDDDKRLFVCACDETGHACIYIVKGGVFKKIPIHSMVDLWPSHLTYIPSFIPIPFVQREEQGLQV